METRRVTVDRIYDFEIRNGRTRFEGWFRAVDGASPDQVVATTFDLFTADTLEIARRHGSELLLTIAKSRYGFDIVRAE